jgi:hypothetical protein
VQEDKKVMSDIRWDLIAHVREQIAAGTYETQGKLRIVSERLVENLQRSGESQQQADMESQCEPPST